MLENEVGRAGGSLQVILFVALMISRMSSTDRGLVAISGIFRDSDALELGSSCRERPCKPFSSVRANSPVVGDAKDAAVAECFGRLTLMRRGRAVLREEEDAERVDGVCDTRFELA